MDHSFQFRDKIRVALFDSDTLEGKALLKLLSSHRWFQVVDGGKDIDLAFSTQKTHPTLSAAVPVITTQVGLGYCLLPEVNSHTISNVDSASSPLVLSHPSGAATALAMALKPLDKAFGLKTIHTSIVLPIEGRDVASLDVLNSVMPVCDNQQATLQEELRSVLQSPELILDVHSTRASMTSGLFQYVTVSFAQKPSLDDIATCWKQSQGLLDLPSAPAVSLQVFEQAGFPQPRLHGHGMAVSVGSLEPAVLGDCRFVVVSDPLMRGPVGGALLNAELLVRRGLVFW